MRTPICLAALAALGLAACSPSGDDAGTAYENVAAEVAAEASPTGDAPAGAATAPPPTVAAPAPVARIAYAYRYALALPRDVGASVMSRHEQACVAAGPTSCQVMAARADWRGDSPGGRLELRGSPAWIDAFRAGLADEARAAGGRLEEAATEGEDVTAGLRSAETRAATDTALTERLRRLQARQGGTLEQRLQVEREIAALQHQIDSRTLDRQALDERVRTARLRIDYRPAGVWAHDSRLRPVAQALSGALGLSAGVLAFLILLGSVLLPIAGLAGAVWLVMQRRRRPARA